MYICYAEVQKGGRRALCGALNRVARGPFVQRRREQRARERKPLGAAARNNDCAREREREESRGRVVINAVALLCADLLISSDACTAAGDLILLGLVGMCAVMQWLGCAF